jgi:hypothetical protein
MFQWVGHQLESDHLDLSFRNTASWTAAGPDYDIKNQWFVLGDPDSGPAVMLGTPPALPEDLWVDTHYHGSDQFRVVIKGEYLVQSRRIKAGDFGYQESGRTYREGLAGGAGDCWIFALHGTWPGARGTLVKKTGNLVINDDSLYDNQLDRFVEAPDDPYWNDVPGGAKGMAALTTTLGPNRAGYAWGSFDETDSWRPLAEDVVATAGMFGPARSGPVLLTIHAGPDRVAIPAAAAETEVVCVVIRGSATIGGKRYEAGDMRVQKSGAALDEVVSGPDGLDMVLLVADRRGRPQIVGNDAVSKRWQDGLDSFCAELSAA